MAMISKTLKRELSGTELLIQELIDYEKTIKEKYESEKVLYSAIKTDAELANLNIEHERNMDAIEMIRSYIYSELQTVTKRRFFKDIVEYKNFYGGPFIRYYQEKYNMLQRHSQSNASYQNIPQILEIALKIIHKIKMGSRL